MDILDIPELFQILLFCVNFRLIMMLSARLFDLTSSPVGLLSFQSEKGFLLFCTILLKKVR